jgi:hypothetical protein
MIDRYDPELLLDYVEGELPDDRRQRVEALLAEDPKLATLLAGMQRDRTALRGLPEATPPHDLAEASLAQLERHLLLDAPPADAAPPVAAPVHRLRLGPLLSYGSLAAVLVLVGAVVFWSLGPGGTTERRGDLATADPRPGIGLADAPLRAQREAVGNGTESPDGATTLGDAPGDAVLAESADRVGPAADRQAAVAAVEDQALGRSRAVPSTAATAPAREQASSFFRAEMDTADQPSDILAAAESAARSANAGDPDLSPGDGPAVYTLNLRSGAPDRTYTQLADWAMLNNYKLQQPAALLTADRRPDPAPAAEALAAATIEAEADAAPAKLLLPETDLSLPNYTTPAGTQNLQLLLPVTELPTLMDQLNRAEPVPAAELRQNVGLNTRLLHNRLRATPARTSATNAQSDQQDFSPRLQLQLQRRLDASDPTPASAAPQAPPPDLGQLFEQAPWLRWNTLAPAVPVQIIIEPTQDPAEPAEFRTGR